jgi:phage repressor protein C with HTH and peptisase S24 domain
MYNGYRHYLGEEKAMPTEKPRVTITMSEQELEQINEYRFKNRINNQTQAILSLVERGFGALQAPQPSVSAEKEKPAGEGGLTVDAHKVGRAYDAAPAKTKADVKYILREHMEEAASEPRLELYAAEEVEYCEVVFCENLASAGTGVYLDDTSPTTIRVRRSALPDDFERWYDKYFSVTVRGDSMLPRYRDGDILLVSRDYVTEGQYGVFTVNGDGFIKQRKGDKLFSLNRKYDDVQLHGYDDVRCNGKVIKVLEPEDIED